MDCALHPYRHPYRLNFAVFVLFAGMFAGIVVCQAEFTAQRIPTGIVILEDGKAALAYHHRIEDPGDFRTDFIHPLYDTYGNQLTDSGKDGSKMPGIHWGWASVKAGDRSIDLVTGTGGHRVFERYTRLDVGKSGAVLGLENAWIFDGSPQAFMMEWVELILWPSEKNNRLIDVHLRFTNVSSGPIDIGSDAATRGGGLFVRLDPELGPFTVSTNTGLVQPGSSAVVSPWLDVSYKLPRSSRYGGVTVFHHPSNPDYVKSAWISGEDVPVATAWPITSGRRLEPGEAIEMWYRIRIHPGFGPEIDLAGAHRAYLDFVANLSKPIAAR